MLNLEARREEYVHRLEASLERLVTRLSALPEVKRISLFGSYARGRRDLFTDLDVLVVMESTESMPERLARLYPLVGADVDLDLFAWTPAEHEEMRGRPFGRAVEREEIVLYEALR
jgi:uncharacterized protein